MLNPERIILKSLNQQIQFKQTIAEVIMFYKIIKKFCVRLHYCTQCIILGLLSANIS